MEQSGDQDNGIIPGSRRKSKPSLADNFHHSVHAYEKLIALTQMCMNKIPLLHHCNIAPLQALLSSGNGMPIEPEPPPVVKIIWSVKVVDILDWQIF